MLIPWAEPTLWGGEEEILLEALRSNWLSGGEFVEHFEVQLAEFLNVPYAVSVSNGTAALHLSFIALGLKPGDEVILPAFGYLAAANIALLCGLQPVFCDVDPHSWCMRADAVEKLITPKTRAIVSIHTYGIVFDLDALCSLAEHHGLYLIEDAAEAFGSRYEGKQAGTRGDVGTFSFHATKTITTGEGGLVVTSNVDICEKLRLYRSHGMKRERYYYHEVPGHNFRLSNLLAAIGCVQLQHFENIAAERRRVHRHYVERLKHSPALVFQEIPSNSNMLIWAVACKLGSSSVLKGRDFLMGQLKNAGIEIRPGFQPPCEMEYFKSAVLPVSKELGDWVFSLPSYPSLSGESLDRICDTLLGLLSEEH